MAPPLTMTVYLLGVLVACVTCGKQAPEDKHVMFMAACEAIMNELVDEFKNLPKEESEDLSGSHMAQMAFPVCRKMKDLEVNFFIKIYQIYHHDLSY